MTNVPQLTQISPETVKALVDEADNIAGEVTDAAMQGPAGWSVAQYDPNTLLKAFPLLHIKPGYRYASYQFCEGGNGNGFPLVIPEDKTLPSPGADMDFDWLETGEVRLQAGSAKLPEWVESDIASVLEGDQSPEAYFQTSLFIRELRELGALWHGSHWSSHTVLTSSPRQLEPYSAEVDDEGDENEPYTTPEWKWELDRPADWRPSVSCREDGEVAVVFYTYSGLEQEAVYLHSDVYGAGYCFQATRETAATGGGGYIY